MPKLKSHELPGMPEENAIASKDMRHTEEEPRVWLLRYMEFSRFTTDLQEMQTAVEDGARVTEYMALENSAQAVNPGMTPMERLLGCEDVLRSLASYLGAGGYNAPHVDPKVFHEKILWSIQQIQHGEMV